MTEKALDKKQIIAELTKSAHGKLDEYLAIGRQAAVEDPDFFAHLVAWNHQKGQIRDAKIALPVIALANIQRTFVGHAADDNADRSILYADNALAHLADLRPRELARVLLTTTRTEKQTVTNPLPKRPLDKKIVTAAVEVPPFMVTANAPRRVLRRLVERYLRDLEADRRQFEYVAVQHRATLHSFYAHFHISRPDWVGAILFNGEKGQIQITAPGIFDKINQLHLMSAEEAAGTIVKYKIPFLVARGALGKKASEPDTVLALIKAMSPTELITNTKWLEKLGVKTNPALRAAFEAALGKVATAKTTKATFKTTRAAEALIDDEVLSNKLKTVQEKQLDKMTSIEGDWLILGDKSGSMHTAIATARMVAATLARMVKGHVHLVFFDTYPRYFDVTGKSLEDITKITGGIESGGGTDMHCGIQQAIERNLSVDGIVFVSDGANHGPRVMPVYQKYCAKMGTEPTLYFYQLDGEPDSFSSECQHAGVDLQTFDLRGQTVDYYSLPNLAQTMRVSRYSLLDEVLATPLRTLDEVLDRTKGMAILPRATVTV